MGKMEYIRECGVNYLRYQMEEVVDYRMEMLFQNQISGFLPVELRRMDEWEWIYCRISGRISLSQCLEKSPLGEGELKGFLESIEGLCQRMEEYLLPFEGLVLKPEYIYVRPGDNQSYSWIYSCREEAWGAETSDGEKLLEYLLDHLDYDDQKAVKLLYAVYQSCRGSGSDIAAIRNAYQKAAGKGIAGAGEAGAIGAEGRETGWESRVRRIYPEEESTLEAGGYVRGESAWTGGYVREENGWTGGSMSGEEARTDWKKENTAGKTGKKGWKEQLPYKIKEVCTIFFGKTETEEKERKERLGGENSKKENSKKEKLRKGKREKAAPAEGQLWRKERMVKAEEKGREEPAGTTLLTGGMMNGGIYCLRARSREDSDMLLTSYPFFIGKDETKMDGVVEDDFVSRYHARIDREEETFRVLDLGSTNGTFLNRERLAPYEARVLQEGDLIGFAHREYEFCFLL